MAQVAVLVDGSFFLKRYVYTYGRNHSPEKTANDLFTMCLKHLEGKYNDTLYRILFYDCPPFEGKPNNPITGKAIDFSKTDLYTFRVKFYQELLKKRKIALRRGHLVSAGGWIIKPDPMKELLHRTKAISDLTENDVRYDLRQKGVDMRMGLDIASIAYKRLANKIILVTGDADFVPAAKLARREGIDVVLDPMWQPVSRDLFEHTDGLHSTCPQPLASTKRT